MRRIVFVWLPRWPTDRLCRALERKNPKERLSPSKLRDEPLALTASTTGGMRLMAINEPAHDHGLCAGQLLADAQALCPDLQTRDVDEAADAQALKALSDWLSRYTPWAAPASGHNGCDGVMLDITGCAHLFGGEAALLSDLLERLKKFGIEARCGLASNLGTAWALAHFVAPPEGFEIAPPEDKGAAILNLPVHALRLEAETAVGLDAVGLKKIRQLIDLPRAPLTARFGTEVAHRLDQALGVDEEPISPQAPLIPYRVKKMLVEPISLKDDMVEGISRLAQDLCAHMARDRKGARRLMALFYRVDGEVTRLAIGTAEPCCDGAHIARLFAEKLDQVAQDFDAGYGFDALGLSASVAEDMTPIQAMMQEVAGREGARKGANGVSPPEDSYKIPSDLSFLMDRLGNRLGPSHVTQFRAFESHIPERAVRSVPVMAIHAGGGVGWDEVPSSRPLAMLACAEPIDVVAEVPEGPPRIFRWRKVSYRVAQIEGPERLAPEWWRQTDVTGMSGKTRDYFRVEDEQGHRFWLYRDGLYDRETSKPRWYVHGVFG